MPIGTRAIPLALDPLFDLSLSFGGVLGLIGVTNASGLGAPQFNIPNVPALIGLGVFVSTFTLDTSMPFGVGFISNHLFFRIEA